MKPLRESGNPELRDMQVEQTRSPSKWLTSASIKVTTLLLLSLASCSSMQRGKIINLADGSILRMSIEPALHGKGLIKAIDPMTQERFEGDYTAIQGISEKELCPAKAFLTGDKGTTLFIDLQVEHGNPPKGMGDAIDNKGNKYQIHF